MRAAVWIKENWLYGVVGWLAFVLSLAVTAVCFIPILLFLSVFGFDLASWPAPFDAAWAAFTVNSGNGQSIVFAAIFFPFAFRNFLSFASYFDKLKPKDWEEQE